MTVFKAFEQGIEVNGTTIQAVVDGMDMFKSLAVKTLSKEGLNIIADENHWYSQQKWLNVFQKIAEKAGDFTLQKIGESIPQNAIFPNNIQTIQDALQSIDIAYHTNHRNASGQVLFDNGSMLEGIGHYHYNSTSTTSAELICNNPYPCAFDLGIISAMAKAFEPTAKVQHKSGHCRKNGDDQCVYEVSW